MLLSLLSLWAGKCVDHTVLMLKGDEKKEPEMDEETRKRASNALTTPPLFPVLLER
jgi:hypothetical protein